MLKLFILLLPFQLFAAEYRVAIAVLDSGIDRETASQKYMCENGEYSFMPGTPKEDIVGHGSNVVSAIGENIDSNVFCVISYKVTDGKTTDVKSYQQTLKKSYQSIQAREARFVNISLEGDGILPGEYGTIKKLIDNGVVISVAAGNSKLNLDEKCNNFPACYSQVLRSKNFHVVGATDTRYSNYGSIVKYHESGIWKNYRGTSQASPIHLAKIIMGKEL